MFLPTRQFFSSLLLAVSLLSLAAVSKADEMPAPFYRELYVTDPMMQGSDVTIAQTLLARDDAVDDALEADGVFGQQSADATIAFQSANGLAATGVLDSDSAQKLLDLHSADGYVDNGFTAASMGYKYKLHVNVHQNRSIETDATLYDAENNVLHTFRTRQHGNRDDGTNEGWPDFGNGDYGLTELASNGNTITGLVEIDLNSPEPDPQVYGPWPVNRIVRGLDGNALLMLPNIRDGILLHTGNWSTETQQWAPFEDMPNSAGCIHAHPVDIQQVYKKLVEIGVEVRENPFSGKSYPYQPQGVGVIELVD